MTRLLPAQRRGATLAIKRMGHSSTILEPDTVSATNNYGKDEPADSGDSDSSEWSTVATEPVIRVYRNADSHEPELERTKGGRFNADNPTLLFRHDSKVESGMRVKYLDHTYEVDAMVTYDSHIEANSTLVNE
ncbi:hypothetical protein ACFQL7_20875 [Halocatena marina]|uniref:Uncharacterized protein n=1 Tax=Halocatena marina TaxID=2934937 RepID=A0ABD5YRE8_9EURY|nr:hypothetical protein [Halocatena marina]